MRNHPISIEKYSKPEKVIKDKTKVDNDRSSTTEVHIGHFISHLSLKIPPI